MRYDLDVLSEFCREIGLAATKTPEELQVPLGRQAILCFQNFPGEDDCMLGFVDTPWHTHSDLIFADPRGHFVELDSLDLLAALRSGEVLICESERDGRTVDRWLIHSQFNDEFRNLETGGRLIVWRADPYFSSSGTP